KQQKPGGLLRDRAAYPRAGAGEVPAWRAPAQRYGEGQAVHDQDLPITDIAEKYVIFTPLSKVKPGEHPVVVVFVADPLQITGLVTLVGAVREGTDPVRVPPMAACQQIGAFVYDEAKKEHPRAVLGYTDLAARANVGKTIPEQMFTFAVPFPLYREMEEEAKDGVFDGTIWKGLAAEKKGVWS